MYSLEFIKAAHIAYNHLCSLRKTSIILEISVSTLKRWKRNHWEHLHRMQRPTKLKPDIIVCLHALVSSNPFITQTQLSLKIFQLFGVSLSRQLVSKALKQNGLTKVRSRKGVPTSASDRQSLQYQSFTSQLRTHLLNKKHVISIDECGFDARTLPIQGYVSKGKRLYVHTKHGGWKRYSVIMAVDKTGVLHHEVYEGSIDQGRFSNFLANLTLLQNSVLLMDNVSFHKTKHVQNILRQKSVDVMFTPCYTPDANPIENVFSILKHKFRLLNYNQSETTTSVLVHKSISLLCCNTSSNVFENCFNRMYKWAGCHDVVAGI
jgi:transposase